jgi:ABC-type bacteriocin/lantibiotic exporter with double-glycine peptidase domain
MILIVCLSCVLRSAVADEAVELVENDCGVRCLYVAVKSLTPSKSLSLKELQQRLAPEAAGNTLGELSDEASRLGFSTLLVSTTADALQIRDRPFMFIAHMKRGHFVLLVDVGAETATIVDPPEKNVVPLSSFNAEWEGAGLILSTKPIEDEASVQRRLWWRQYRLHVVLGVILLATAIAGIRHLYAKRA